MKIIIYLCLVVAMLCVVAVMVDVLAYRVGMSTAMVVLLFGLCVCGITNNWSDE